MSLCPMCERIRKIRVKQRKEYYHDLCCECQKKIRKTYLLKERRSS